MRARLLELGLDWDAKRSGRSNWDNIHAAIRTAPPGSPLHIAHDPDGWLWGLPYYAELVNIFDLLSAANFQRTGDRAEMSRWKPRPRPGDNDNTVEIITGGVMTIDEFGELFG